MFSKKEIAPILIAIIVLAFSLALLKPLDLFLSALLSVSLVLGINIIAKKIAAFYLDSQIEINLWELKRPGMLFFLNILPVKTGHPSREFKPPIPIGAILPVVLSFLSAGNLTWFAPLTFEAKSRIYKAAKRHGLYKFSEIAEAHIGLIAAIGILANLFFALVGYFIGYEDFAQLNIYFALFNLLPLSTLDGNKIFFGNKILWTFLAAITLIGFFFAVFII